MGVPLLMDGWGGGRGFRPKVSSPSEPGTLKDYIGFASKPGFQVTISILARHSTDRVRSLHFAPQHISHTLKQIPKTKA